MNVLHRVGSCGGARVLGCLLRPSAKIGEFPAVDAKIVPLGCGGGEVRDVFLPVSPARSCDMLAKLPPPTSKGCRACSPSADDKTTDNAIESISLTNSSSLEDQIPSRSASIELCSDFVVDLVWDHL